MRNEETVTLLVVSNSGDEAMCDVILNEEVVEQAEFPREEVSRDQFLKDFKVGSTQTCSRAETTPEEHEKMCEEAARNRLATKPSRCRNQR